MQISLKQSKYFSILLNKIILRIDNLRKCKKYKEKAILGCVGKTETEKQRYEIVSCSLIII